ncbi:GvpT/GvpP family gas vesicle accessory protein [Alkalihalobacillus macyae]|uniref:GvpT/GvpP family gas vesicle accessory protein n=1 Tax=Guptibacillus hwajinpoensis TaxID=208199 RepID=UPI00273B6C38|nr:GvpT/GvpP family gas vesicle accessory protein [Alkalihalobacillus macyae]MDP4551625.1 GvpT/GvpP family gas vesicle accessory protein [Alkalihalobacillus macyae]
MAEIKDKNTSSKILSQPAEGDTQTQGNSGDRPSVNYAILGGVVGAGIGLLSSPGASKKVVDSIGKSEAVRNAGQEIRRTAQEFITEQALITLRQTATGYMSKYEGRLAPRKKNEEAQETEQPPSHSNEEIEEIKEENKNLNERLDRIENMLSSLVDSK